MKRLFSTIISLTLLSGILFSSYTTVSATEGIQISAKSAILIEALTGKVIFEKNSNQIMPMASTTKIMTTLLSLESGDLDEYFTVDPNAIKVEGSSMGLVEGDQVTKRVLCYGMMLPSGNDAANATAVKIAGSLENFAVLMNERAKKIGMSNTHFVTPSGLDDYTDLHYSTSYDMALLAREALKNPIFQQICSTKNARLEFGNPPYVRWLANSNKLLSSCKGAIGVKTGFTDKARRCLVSACERDGIKLICVTLNDPNDWLDHTNLYNYGFSQVTRREVPIDNLNIMVNVVGGEKNVAFCKQIEPAKLPLYPEDLKKVEKKVIIPQFAYAPLKKGDVIGHSDYVLNGEIIQSIPILLDEDINELPEKPKSRLDSFIDNIFNRLK